MPLTLEPLPLLLRRSKAMELTGLKEETFSKVVEARVLEPVYLVWEVLARNGRVLFSAPEAKAAAYTATNPGTKARPAGQAYYRREDVLKLASKTT